MLRLLQMGPSKVLTTFPLQIQSSWQLSFLELPPCHNTVTPSSESSDIYTSTVQSSPTSANAALSPHSRLQTFYPPSAHYISSPSVPTTVPRSWLSFCASCLHSFPLNLSGFFNGMLEVFEPESTELLHFLSSHPVDLICIQQSNLNSSSSFRILCFAF